MRQQIVRNDLASLSECGNRSLKVNGIPKDDRGNGQIEATSAMSLIFMRSITEFAETVEEHCLCQSVLRLTLV